MRRRFVVGPFDAPAGICIDIARMYRCNRLRFGISETTLPWKLARFFRCAADKSSEVIYALRPVRFRYKKQFDPKGAPEFGLVAEDVAKVDRDLIVADDEGKPFTVRYEEVNAMLLNEFLKEHNEVEQLKATVAQLKASLETQAGQIQKEGDRPEASGAAHRLAVSAGK